MLLSSSNLKKNAKGLKADSAREILLQEDRMLVVNAEEILVEIGFEHTEVGLEAIGEGLLPFQPRKVGLFGFFAIREVFDPDFFILDEIGQKEVLEVWVLSYFLEEHAVSTFLKGCNLNASFSAVLMIIVARLGEMIFKRKVFLETVKSRHD